MFCKYRVILSIDGCGMRGVIPLRILDYLHQSMSSLDEDLDVTSWVDVFSAASSSSIFTGALMLKNEKGKSKHTPAEILEFYLKRGQQVFGTNLGLDPEHSMYPLSFVLDHFFGGVSLRDLRNHFVFVCQNQTDNELFPFTNNVDRNYDLPLSKVMAACSAKPGVYPPLTLGVAELVDASPSFRNPALMAYQYARMLYPSDPIILISIGVGDEVPEMPNQAKEVHDELNEIRLTVDDHLLYYRFQTEIQQRLELLPPKELDAALIELAEDYIFHNQGRFMELLKLMALRAA